MIQRIQSVYLLLCAILATVFTFLNEHTFLMLGDLGLLGVSPSIASGIIAIVAFGTIFLFRNRPLQIKLLWLAIFVSILALGLYVFVDGFTAFFLDWEFYILPVALVFIWLAKVGVQNDENLIRSSDRLR